MTTAATTPDWEVTRAFEGAVAAAAGVRNAADAALVDLVVRALDEGWWEGWKIHTPVQWLMWQTGVNRSTARRIVALARRAGDLPTVMATFRRGGLSLDQAATVARYTPAEYEASVCELAVNATVNQIVAATRQYGFDADITDRDSRERPGPERSVSFGTDESDQWSARIKLPADEGQIVEEALKASRERLHDAQRAAAKARAEAEGRPTTGTDADLGVEPVGWADAFVGMAHSTLITDATGAEVSTRPGVLLHLQAPVEDADTWRAEIHQGPALPPSMRRYLTCDCDIAAVWHADGHPVQVGRTHRIVPRRIRRLVEHRDGGCRVPGCDSHLWVEVHHIVHWEDHGDTVTWNLICLCGRHHRSHHMGLLGITGNADIPDGVVFTTATGRVLRPSGTPTPPTAMPVVEPYDGPTGENLHKHWVTFTRRPPCDRSPERRRDREPVA